jgi:hypothetical protein
MSDMKWLWPSTKPGTSVRPARSVTSVAGPASFITSAAVPTATIFPFAIATASAAGWAGFTVTIGPPRMIRSAGAAAAAHATSHGSQTSGTASSTPFIARRGRRKRRTQSKTLGMVSPPVGR